MEHRAGILTRVPNSSLVGVLVPAATTGNLTLMLVDPHGETLPHAFFIDKHPSVFAPFWDPQGVTLSERQKKVIEDLQAKYQ